MARRVDSGAAKSFIWKGICRVTSIGLNQTQDPERSETANVGESVTHATEMGVLEYSNLALAGWRSANSGARTVRISRTSDIGLDTNRRIKIMNI